MRPDTWLPTVTFITGFSVPVAVTSLRQFAARHRRRLIMRRICLPVMKIPNTNTNDDEGHGYDDSPLHPRIAAFFCHKF